MNKRLVISIVVIVIFILTGYGYVVHLSNRKVDVYVEKSRTPVISPDYAGLIIPPNISPLNFEINEDGVEFFVEISSLKGDAIKIFSDSKKITIPIHKWQKLLKKNVRNRIAYSIYCKTNSGKWLKYKTFYNTVADDEIDSYLAYRLIAPGYILWGNIGIYQRDLESFDEDAVVKNSGTGGNCMNCHSFNQQNPDNMMFHVRAGHGGTVIIKDGKIKKVNTKIPQIISAGVYPSWHPNGNLIAFSVNKIGQYFHAVAGKSKEVLDFASDIIVYNIKLNTVSSSPALVTNELLETFPNWSPDGKYLYFCRATLPDSIQIVESDSTNQFQFDSIKYSMMRISYDEINGSWGDPEVLISSKKTNKSVSFPRVSPDNRFVMFCMSDYGTFSINHKSSDLYIYDIEQQTFRKMSVNSDETDSFHSWSSNSRWFVYSSKRYDGVFARPYICYFDKNGDTGKPFILPQKDPEFYNSFLKSYNVPEFIKRRIDVNTRALYNVVNSDSLVNATLDSKINTDAFTGETAKVPVH